MANHDYGIGGQQAPELHKFDWIGSDGNNITPIQLKDYKGKFVVLYCFQSWCPGCHSVGLPSLQKMTNALVEKENIKFFAVQTVFEGKAQNTFEKLRETQIKYDLKIPFGQDEGNETTRNISSIMHTYHTGGTPWFIFINPEGKVIFNDFHLNAEAAIKYLEENIL